MTNCKVKNRQTGEVTVISTDDFNGNVYTLVQCPCSELITVIADAIMPEPTSEVAPVEPSVEVTEIKTPTNDEVVDLSPEPVTTTTLADIPVEMGTSTEVIVDLPPEPPMRKKRGRPPKKK